MKKVVEDKDFAAILETAARLLTTKSYPSATLDEIAQASGIPIDRIIDQFPTLHDLATVILEHERESMRAIKEQVANVEIPTEKLLSTFRLVGESWAHDRIVRAGVRLSIESREYFPERRMDPYTTWYQFVKTQVTAGQTRNLLFRDVDPNALTRLLITAALGVRDVIMIRDDWANASALLKSTLSFSLNLVSTQNVLERHMAQPAAGIQGSKTVEQ